MPAKEFRDRVKRIVQMPASALKVNPRNWRMHPEYQTRCMNAVLERIGFVGAVLARELVPDTDDLELIDGHLRRELLGNQLVTVLVTDLTEAEALEVLVTYDQLSTLALPNNDNLKSLLNDLKDTGTPLMDLGWSEFKLESVMGDKWIPPASSSTEKLEAAKVAGEASEAQKEGEESSPEFAAGFKIFTVPLTVAQESIVRNALRISKAKHGLESSGDALHKIIEEWTGAQENT